MKKFVKIVITFVVDLCNILIWLIYQLTNQHFKSDLKNASKKKPIYILGNGPSLLSVKDKIQDRSKINLCTVNFSVLTDIFMELKPEYHVIVDPAFFELEKNTQDVKNRVLQFFETLNSKVTWNMTLIVSAKANRKTLKKLLKNDKIRICQLPGKDLKLDSDIFQSLMFLSYRKGLAMLPCQNVVMACIYFAITIGYKEIQLYGVEHSWIKYLKVNENNIVCQEDVHYYGKTKLVPFYKDKNSTFTMAEILTAFAKMFSGYEKLQRYAKYCGSVQIINMTKDSYIDAFQRGNN